MTSKDVTEADIQSNIPLVGRKPDQISTTVNVGDVEFSEGKFVVIAGPCTIEGREMMLETGTSEKEAGASMIRGGAFKPLTFPYRNEKMFQLDSFHVWNLLQFYLRQNYQLELRDLLEFV